MDSQDSLGKQLQKKQLQVDNKKKDEKSKVHRGIFIADQRRKGRGGRIKSNSIPNKIQVRMKRDVGYLHESQVQWIEITRINKKQRAEKKKQSKKMKFKEKNDKGQSHKSQTKKFVAKQQKDKSQKMNNNKEDNKINGTKNQKETKQELSSQKIEDTTHTQCQQKHDEQQDSSNSSSDQNENNNQKQQNENKNTEDRKQLQQERKQQVNFQQKRQQDDIVVIAQIKKEISNPFWKKSFVGVMRFSPIDKPKQKQKFKQKDVELSHIHKIMDDFYLDLHPIHPRLPVCEIERTQKTQKIFEQYIKNNLKINSSQKGGKIRNQILDELQSTYALVRFLEWDKGRAYVQLYEVIGKAKTIQGECNCFLYEHELNNFQHKKQIEQTSQIQLNITPLHKKFTEMVFTIDPLTSTDLDDALSVTKINEKEYEIGIHISDVSTYLHKISREQIAKRTTSVYLPSLVYHMLPEHFVNICSINPGVQRLAFSVFAKMNLEGDVLESRLQKNVLMSRFKLAYEQAQAILDSQMSYEEFNKIHVSTEQQFKILVQKLQTMSKIALAHRSKRLIFQIFDNEQINFQLDDDKWPINFKVSPRIAAKKIVEEFMIIGNIEAAKKATQIDPKNTLIIYHPKPSDLAIRQFNEYFSFLKYKIKFQNSLTLQKDLVKISQMQDVSEDIKKLCYFKARRVQQSAAYKRFSSVSQLQGNLHFALGLRYYTHFTSPMRRIADILVHEALNQAISPNIPKLDLLEKQIELANWGRKGTKKLKKDLTEIYLCLMIYRTKKQIPTQGIVSSFGTKSVSIYIPLFDMNKQFMWKDLQVDKIFKNKEDKQKLDVVIFYSKKDSKKDIIWVLKKFDKIPIKIGCSTSIPLRLVIELQVKTNKGVQIIKPCPQDI